MGVVSRWMWVESMGVASGCGCKEVYRFPHITYPYSSFFAAASLLFVHFLKCFSFSIILYIAILNSYTHSIIIYIACITKTATGANQIGTALEMMPKNVETS